MRGIKRFTLVELLVVTGCLAVLASMTLPATNRAREIALQTSCSGNLRQSVQGLLAYSQSYDGWCALNKDGYYNWCKSPGMPQELGLNETTDLNIYTNRKITICPGITVNPNGWGTNQCYGVPRYWGQGSTDFNEVAVSPVELSVDGWLMTRVNLLQDASKYIILGDAAYGPQFASGNIHQISGEPCPLFCRRDANFAGLAKWHLGNANVAYADGHAADTSDRSRLFTDSKIGNLLSADGLTVEKIGQ